MEKNNFYFIKDLSYAFYWEVKKEYSAAEKQTTNNRMEVMAVIEGLKRLKYPCNVDVYSDSAYTVNAFLNGWIYAWRKNGWKKADGKAVLNTDLWEELYTLTQTHSVTFHKVAGHADNELNNRCDELARAAILEFRATLPIAMQEEDGVDIQTKNA